jgi:hypothetical protein
MEFLRNIYGIILPNPLASARGGLKMPAILAKNSRIALGLLGFYEFDVETSVPPSSPAAMSGHQTSFVA